MFLTFFAILVINIIYFSLKGDSTASGVQDTTGYWHDDGQPMFNIDGAPMMGMLDTNGNFYGVADTRTDL